MKTVIEMAREAGLVGGPVYARGLERFAELVRADAIAAEREACAKLAETPVGEYEVIVACGTDPVPHRIPRYLEWDSIANAIRARSNT